MASSEYYYKNRETIREKAKRRYLLNKEKISKKHKIYHINNKDAENKRCKKYYNENKDKIAKKKKEYYTKNKLKMSEKCYEYQKNVWYKSQKNKINRSILVQISKSIKNKNSKHWEDIVGYTLEDLINHLQNNSNYLIEDYSNINLHIDHIIPKSLYKFESYEDEEFKKCWSLRNLRLIPAEENLSRSKKLDLELVNKFNVYDLLPKEPICGNN